MRLLYRVISCDGLGAWIDRLRLGDLALGIVRWLPVSSLSQIHVACSTRKMSSFPLEKEKNIQAMKSYRFLQWRRTRLRSKKSSTAPWLSLRTDQPSSLVFFSFLVEFRRDTGIEWRGILYPVYPVLLQSPTTQSYSLHSAMILTHTIACSHKIIFFSETKHCYSRNDVRSQLDPFSTIPRSWTWKFAKL